MGKDYEGRLFFKSHRIPENYIRDIMFDGVLFRQNHQAAAVSFGNLNMHPNLLLLSSILSRPLFPQSINTALVQIF